MLKKKIIIKVLTELSENMIKIFVDINNSGGGTINNNVNMRSFFLVEKNSKLMSDIFIKNRLEVKKQLSYILFL